MNSFWIILFSLCAMIVNSLGIFAIYKNQRLAERIKGYCICFSAGMLITTPLIITLPEAIEKTHNAGFIALLGFLFMYFSNKFIKKKTRQRELTFGITVVEGICIHSLLDGIIYAVTFSISFISGILSGIGLIVHEFAEGIITFSTLRHGGVKTKNAGIISFFVSSLSTPIGAIIALPIMNLMFDGIFNELSVLVPVVTSHKLVNIIFMYIIPPTTGKPGRRECLPGSMER